MEAVEVVDSQAARPAITALPRVRRRGLFLNLCAFTLLDFFRSAWVFLNLLTLVGVQALVFQYAPSQSNFFGVEYAATSILAGITSAALFARANRAESYAILARPVPYALYTGAIMLVAWAVAMLGHFISALAVVLRYGNPFDPSAQTNYWLALVTDPNGTTAVAVAAAFAVAIITLLSPFVSGSGVRLLVLVVLAILVMSFDARNFPIETVRPIMESLPPVLAPIAGALKFATQTPPDNVAQISLLILAGYTIFLTFLALVLSSTREMVLE